MEKIKITEDNFRQGALVDDECMGGISEHPEKPGVFAAFVMNHKSGEMVSFEAFPSLGEAIVAINKIERDWQYEAISECGDHEHGDEEGGGCGSGGCGGCSCH